jgi:hypothetical protein
MKKRRATIYRILTILALIACFNTVFLHTVNDLVVFEISRDHQFPLQPAPTVSLNCHFAEHQVMDNPVTIEFSLPEKPTSYKSEIAHAAVSGFFGFIWQPPKKS